MPGKKKGKKKGKGKSKSKGKKSGKKSSTSPSGVVDPIAPEYVPPPPKPGEKLINLLTKHPVDEKEVHGVKVSTRVLKDLTPEEIRDLRLVFELFDTNDDGYIGSGELKRAMRSLGFKVKNQEAKEIIADVSLKGKSMVDFTEFLEIIIDRQGDSRDMYDEILKGFSIFDRDQTGYISLENLKTACEDSGIRFSPKELEEMIREADTNGDGLVDKSEFIRIMLQTNLF